jgi:hypothetical protein
MSLMSSEPHPLDDFRRLLNRRAKEFPVQWEASRRLIGKQEFPATVDRLVHQIREIDLPAVIKEPLCHLFARQQAQRIQDLDAELLRMLTGLPPAKALRALCIFFELVTQPGSQWPVPAMSGREIEEYVRRSVNPFDLLRDAEVASLLDLGAGDLSFAEEVAEQYLPELQRQHRPFILHCLDRLDPRSKLGGPLHPDQERLRRLREREGLRFGFFGNQDMFALQNLDDAGALAPRYLMATCWAPATPTFAYEPSRLSEPVIAEDLLNTKGAYRPIRFQGEPSLEVRHGERVLLFPPWKFEVIGPLALLSLLACRGALCILGAVDNQVFWELLAQLLDEPRYRPQDRPFTPATLPDVFGEVYEALNRLPIGDSVDLADLGTIRRPFQAPSPVVRPSPVTVAFRYVRISRGATFPGIPTGSTAKKFSAMAEEAPPWFLTLIPS